MGRGIRGARKVNRKSNQGFLLEGSHRIVKDYILSGNVCQHSKCLQRAQYGLPQPLEVPYTTWTSISTDLIILLSQSQGKTQIMVVVDWFTKIAHFITLEGNAIGEDIVGTVLPEVWKPHRLPTDIISHMEAKLSGEYWQSLCNILALKQHMSTAYHPQSDRQTERTNQVLEGYLRTIVNYDQNYWYQLLPLVDHTYNNSATNPHKMTTCFAKTIFHAQTEWMKERGAQNRRPTMYADLMQDIH